MIKKQAAFSIVLLTLLSTIIWAQSQSGGFTVAGEISFEKKGDIYLRLASEIEFKNRKKESVFQTMISVGSAEIEKGRVSFKFTDVPEGLYVIRSFQDENGNGELDSGLLGPKEPWAMYGLKRPVFKKPKFEEISFEVNRNITDICFKLK
jgi:uncharacterized protein (DUF2141 family)